MVGMAGEGLLTIGELARSAGLTAKTVRFWSDQGLLPPAGRTPAGYRLYGPDALGRLGLILAVINGWPSQPPVLPAAEWLAAALRNPLP